MQFDNCVRKLKVLQFPSRFFYIFCSIFIQLCINSLHCYSEWLQMKKTFLKLFISLALSLLFFFVLLIAVNGNLYSYLAGLLGYEVMDNRILVLVLALIPTALLFTNIYQLLNNRIHRFFIRAEIILYILALFAIVMLKARGYSAINLDITGLYFQIIEFPEQVVLNLLLFIPAGALLFKFVRSPLKALVIALVSIIVIETAQLVFSLGVFDVVDIFVNMLGLSLGFMTVNISYDAGFSVAAIDSKYLKIKKARLPKDAAPVENLTKRLRNKLAFTGVTYFVLCLGIAIGFAFYDYQPYVPQGEATYTYSDKTLNALPTATISTDYLKKTIEDMNKVSIDNAMSSSDWVQVSENGFLSSSGRVSNYDNWHTETGKQYYGLTLSIEEQISGISVTHEVPLIVDEYTTIICDGLTFKLSDFGTVVANSHYFRLQAVFSLQDGWFKAEKLTFKRTNEQELQYGYFNFSELTKTTLETKKQKSAILMDIRSDGLCTIDAIADSFYEDYLSGDVCFTAVINDVFGNALIRHTFVVFFEEKYSQKLLDTLSADDNHVRFSCTLKDGRLCFVDTV